MIDTPRGRHTVTYAPDWFSTIQTTVHETRSAIFLLRLDAYDKAQAGDADGAVRSCQAALNAGCSIGDEPSLLAQLTRYVDQAAALSLLERALAQGDASNTVLAVFQLRLEAVEPEPLLLYALRGHRAGVNQFFENVRNGVIPIGNAAAMIGRAGKSDLSLEALLRVPGFIATQQTAFLQYMNALVEIAELPPDQWAGPLAAQQTKKKELTGLVGVITGAEFRVAQGCCRNHAHLRCAIVALAAERYRHSRGKWPASPDDLVKAGLLKAVPGDPFAAGKPIKFARRADGITIYSVGDNGIDDGGDLTRDRDGIGADLGFRLWDVTARRQPAKP